MLILVINSGSSSVKFRLFQKSSGQLKLIVKGQAEALGLSNSQFTLENGHHSESFKVSLKNHTEALKLAVQEMTRFKIIGPKKPISLIGHRVVHGGEKYKKPIVITPTVLKNIKAISGLAPLHNPANIACIEACQKIFPKIKQVAAFDTAFHSTLSKEAFLYALPPELYQKHGIRRYGFHGINHQFVCEEATKLLRARKFPYQRLITIHLGNGCSITAIKNGKSIDTSMGYTPLEGLIMGTRSGDIDPALIAIITQKLKISEDKAIELLNKKSGLLGLSGISSDMRPIWAAAQKLQPRALLTIQIYSRRIAKYLNSYIGLLGGVDAIIFTAGIGENAFYVRKQVMSYLRHLQINLDQSKNRKNNTFINSANSKAKVMIIPANEEMEIARQALQLMKKHR